MNRTKYRGTTQDLRNNIEDIKNFLDAGMKHKDIADIYEVGTSNFGSFVKNYIYQTSDRGPFKHGKGKLQLVFGDLKNKKKEKSAPIKVNKSQATYGEFSQHETCKFAIKQDSSNHHEFCAKQVSDKHKSWCEEHYNVVFDIEKMKNRKKL